jgi:hypothetical protein
MLHFIMYSNFGARCGDVKVISIFNILWSGVAYLFHQLAACQTVYCDIFNGSE